MILTPTNSAQDWRDLLTDPQKHWRKGYSAMSLAYCWEEAKGFPTAVKKALASCQALKDLEPILAIPEHKVNLPGGRAASQNDLFVLGRAPEGLVTIMVEGKVSEPFGPLVSEWYVDPSPGKTKRLGFLCNALGLSETEVQTVRYQLLHRTVSALIEARRFHATTAVMLVHSFSKTKEWFDDYRQFAGLFDLDVEPGKLYLAGKLEGIDLYLGWVSDDGDYGEKTSCVGTVVSRECPHCGHHEIGVETVEGEFVPVSPGTKVKLTGGE
jgi:hypothetical protein